MFVSQLIWRDLWHEVQMMIIFWLTGCRQWSIRDISCTIGGWQDMSLGKNASTDCQVRIAGVDTKAYGYCIGDGENTSRFHLTVVLHGPIPDVRCHHQWNRSCNTTDPLVSATVEECVDVSSRGVWLFQASSWLLTQLPSATSLEYA